MRILREVFHGVWTLGAIIRAGFRGVVTIMAFTEGGLMRQFSLSKRTIALTCIVLMGLTAGSTATLFTMGRDQYYRSRMKYLERENLAMTSLLQGQAEQLSKLKLEMARLKELEESVRQVAGLSVASDLQATESEAGGGRESSRGRR